MTPSALAQDDRPSDLETPQKGVWQAVIVLFVLAVAMLLPHLGDAPLAGTEGHRSISAHQMVERGEYLVPHLYGRTYLRKPPLHYWCIAAMETIAGRANEWVWRLPSVLQYAGLAALLAWTGGRFFGPRGAWVSGVSLLAIVPLWAQARTADIDTLNSLTATAAAVAILLLPITRHPALCVIAGGAALGACLMTKGPAGLPIVVGASAAILVLQRTAGGSPAGPSSAHRLLPRVGQVFLVWGIGLVLFGIYVAAVVNWFHTRGLPLDWSGLDEGAGNLKPDSLGRFFKALLLPLSLIAFALPASLGLLIVLRPVVCRAMDPAAARIVVSVALGVLIAWGVQLLTGMHNERYAYPTLPLLALLAGAVASQLPRFTDQQRSQLRIIVLIAVIAWLGGIMAMAGMAWARSPMRIGLVCVAVLAVAMTVCVVIELGRRRRWTGMAGMLVLVPLAAIAFGDLSSHKRADRSGQQAADTLRKTIGTEQPCLVGAILRYQPELLYYAGVKARAYREDIPRPEELKESTWLILLDDAQNQEFTRLYQPRGDQLKTIVRFESNKKPCYAVYFEVGK